MRCFSYFLIFSLSALYALQASESSRQKYLDLILEHPDLVHPLGDASKGEIELILNPQRMASIEEKMKRDVGVIAQDRYWIWINDACLFPNGKEGVYGRIIWTSGLDSPPGVVILPITPEGKIVLNCNFRHSTRSWEIELPRGACEPDESLEAAARRETLEETGMVVSQVHLLGMMPPDTGLTSTVAPIFLAETIYEEERDPEESEAIEAIILLSISEIKEAFKQGYYLCTIRGKEHSVSFRDPFLAYALLLYELKAPSFKEPSVDL